MKKCDSSTADSNADEFWMDQALQEARKGAAIKEVPIGAILVDGQGNEVARAHNTRESQHQSTGHAELIVIAQASQKLKRWRLNDCTLYVTLEPCLMCAGASLNARLKRLVFGASDPKSGAVKSLYEVLSDSRLNHQVSVSEGILASECGNLLKEFFAQLRKSSRSSACED